jgi:hypothetical protein
MTQVQEVRVLSDMFPRDIADVDYIDSLSRTGQWCIVSIDTFRKHHRAEREAIRRGGHTVFVLESQWSDMSFWQKAERLVKWWPQIVQQAALVERAMFAVPFRHSPSTKFKQITL